MTETRIHAHAELLRFWAPFRQQIVSNLSDNGRAGPPTFWTAAILAKVWLNFLQTYVLPLLYGGLGAIAYVVRRLIAEINSATYREATKSPYLTRILLGGLAGLAIGWFYHPTGAGAEHLLKALSPLAFAFLAGYSVELLFSAMDRLLDAFSSRSSATGILKDQ